MKTRVLSVITGLLCVITIAAGISYLASSNGQQIPESVAQERVIVASAKWIKDFKSLREMTTDSDLVVVGVVTDIGPSRLIGDSPEAADAAINAGAIPGLLVTDYQYKIEQVLKGKASVGDIITLTQTGGFWNGLTQYIQDDPLYELDERTILFLQDISGDSVLAPNEQKYTINGTPQARFRIIDGQVFPVMEGDALANELRGLSETDFVQMVLQVVAP